MFAVIASFSKLKQFVLVSVLFLYNFSFIPKTPTIQDPGSLARSSVKEL